MELKVWVEGIQRVVCGVCDRTTCQDVVYALAHATGKTGRFTLIERWRNNERLLAPHEHPLKVLMKWGEYSSDVHFILQRTALDSPSGGSTPSANNKNNAFVSPGNNKNVPSRPTKTSVDPLHGFTPPAGLSSSSSSSSPSKDLKKSLTFSGGRPAPTDSPQPGGGGGGGGGERKLNVGVVRGIPQQPHQAEVDEREGMTPPLRQNGLMDIKPYQQHPSVTSPAPPHQYHLNDHHQVHRHNQQQQQQQYSPSDAGQLVYPRYDPSYGRIVRPVNGGTVESPSTPPHPAQYSALHRDTPPGRAGVNSSQSPAEDLIRFPPPYRNPPQPFSSAGSPNRPPPPPPPYREPPRPSRGGGSGGGGGLSPGYRASPTLSPSRSCNNTVSSSPVSTSTPNRPSPVRHFPYQVAADERHSPAFHVEPGPSEIDALRRSSRRNLKLDLSGSGGGSGRTPSPPPDPVHAQLIQKVNRQRSGLDEQQDRLVYLEQELAVWEERLHRRLEEERQRLTTELIQLEEHCRQQENQLSDFLGAEEDWERVCREGRDMTEELARWRADVASIETRIDQYGPTMRSLRIDVTAAEERLTAELESELTRVKAELEAAGQEERSLDAELERVDEEVAESEGRLQGIRAQMDSLTQEIKEANLQSLSIAPADDLKVLLEGSYKSGHSRRMLGSPRQLENPVPTNKNPHGVWV